jgi:nitrate reductase gamma subunit
MNGNIHFFLYQILPYITLSVLLLGASCVLTATPIRGAASRASC